MVWSYRAALDGLRCLAVYLVLLYHSGMTWFGGGFIGVDLFFVLSGFLVTNVILSEVDSSGRLRFARFYARRVRRLLPAAVMVIVATSAAYVVVASQAARIPLVRDAQSALLYVANWRFLVQSNDYFAEGVDRSPFLHFWSLGIEEQFYVVFPLLLLGLVWLSRRRPGAVGVGLTLVLVGSVAAQIYWAGADATHAYYGTGARLYQLMAGALLAIALRHAATRATSGGLRRWVYGLVTAAGLAGLVLLGTGVVDVSPSVRGLAATLASVAAIYGLMGDERSLFARILSWSWPVYLGRISYGTYLWHWPVALVLLMVLDSRPLVIAVLVTGVATGLAALSFELVEMPIRRASWLNRHGWATVVVGVAASATVAVTVAPAVLESDAKPSLVANQTSPAAPLQSTGGANTGDGGGQGGGNGGGGQNGGAADPNRKVPDDINWNKVSNDRGPDDTYCTPDDIDSCVVAKGDGPTVVLVGDSHARSYAPMFTELAKDHDLTLALNIVRGCPWRTGVVNQKRPGDEQESCAEARRNWYEKVLPELDPDLVVLSEQPRENKGWQGDLVAADGSDAGLRQLFMRSTDETLKQVHSAGARALTLESMLETGDLDPLDCLSSSQQVDQCLVTMPTEDPFSDAYLRTKAAQQDKTYTLDLDPVFCSDAPICRPIIDGTVVWRNHDHLTGRIGIKLRQQVWKQIRQTGAIQTSG